MAESRQNPARHDPSEPGRPVIVWFRDDLRLADNPALAEAARTQQPLVCVFCHDEASPGLRPLGGAARWWLHGSLAALDQALRKLGGQLVMLRGPAREIIEQLASACNAGAVYWNRRYGAAERSIDESVKTALRAKGIEAASFNGHLLHEPWTVRSRTGQPFRVFSAFWRTASALGTPPRPLAAPHRLSFHALDVAQLPAVGLTDLQLEPSNPDWAGGLREAWIRGEPGARPALDRFLETALTGYAERRDRPDRAATSRLSAYLRFGNISVRQVWHAASAAAAAQAPAAQRGLEKFLAELGWREFSYHLLFHNPELACRNLQPRFDGMPWRHDPHALAAWQRGQTGYPLVDAGMRELWATGYMHNRVRMIAASFLVKHLLIDWREGEAWFWDTLIDADPANNAASWQWVAGSGADAAPFFRIFNPVLQGERFDPDGAYVKQWLPELASLPASRIHRPWEAGEEALAKRYPPRLVLHDAARERALAAFRSLG
ncbi:deoxyribodipyrimidine photo-lyase [Chelatococcus sp. XZ-Ab1]|uniref:cryptochrome/photolyase family protein n=1 Tax=Chelatococcus sp. XZ-Ab1 TaxID=3034027 RepID=UPI0023E3C717|nr:deoxyribodipyrimidine photo-lyase [Chelatococcus sp. XZ-Ab1]